MIVFHGSSEEIKTPRLIQKFRAKDFGEGFYCSIIKEQAIRSARKYETPIVNTYQFRIDESLKILNFKDSSTEWLDFIVACRNGQRHDYDIVIGAMIDDQIYNCFQDYFERKILREQFWVLSKFRYPTHQVCFCTKEALNCLTFVKSEGAHD